MNIFVLSEDPAEAARFQLDKHVVKMPLETAQLLCSVFEPGVAPYKRTHYNHPCAIWTREAEGNFRWLIQHGLALCAEYTCRYGKTHASERVIRWVQDIAYHPHDLKFATHQYAPSRLTPFAQAMPDEYKHVNAVKAYRAYYKGAKAAIATWKQPATVPEWWYSKEL